MEFKLEDIEETFNGEIINKISNNEYLIKIQDKEYHLQILNINSSLQNNFRNRRIQKWRTVNKLFEKIWYHRSTKRRHQKTKKG